MAANHKFKTSKQEKKKSTRKFILLFLVCAIIIGSVSVAVLFKNNIFSDLFSNKTTAPQENATQNQTVDLPEKLEGRAKILLFCTDREESEIFFLAMVDADMEKQSFEVHPFNPDNEAYLTALSTGGEKELVSAVEKAEGVDIDRYIASDTDTFALAINYMGGLGYTVDERIEHRTDEYTLILTQGSQTIKGENLLKYFRYCKTFGDEGRLMQGEIICTMIDNYITAENVEKGDKIYENVLSKINSQSDISHIEAKKALQMLKILCNSDERKPSTVVTGG